MNQPTPSLWRSLQRDGAAWWPRLLGARDARSALRATLHAVLIGGVVGSVGLGFYALLRAAEHLLLGQLAGYRALLPAGELEVAASSLRALSPIALVLLPALGGLAAGLVVHRFAPESGGGGGDAYVASFHSTGAAVRRRVAWVKMLATALTLGTGGSAGREGPTMQVGAALADRVARKLGLSRREQRRLLIAGSAAGLTAMFGTPLGAALLATEVLYRDDFESDALVPAILASVVSFALIGTVLPEQRDLFAHAHRYDVSLVSLGLCLPLVLVLVAGGRAFIAMLARSRRLFRRLERPWLRPAAGGLALGALGTLSLYTLSPALGLGQVDVGLLGSGYGAAQIAIVGASWLPPPAYAAATLAGLAVLKMLATSLTLGSGGVGGDFGPSLAIGALLGGAFGWLARAYVDPSIDPGFFALVGMGAFYGSLAKVPLASLVIVCELTGTYDLLVPLMLTNTLATLALRNASLYRQPATRFDSPLHAAEDTLDVLKRMRVGELPIEPSVVVLRPTARCDAIEHALDQSGDAQVVFPVVDESGRLSGLARRPILARAVRDPSLLSVLIAADLADPPVHARLGDDLHSALEQMLDADLRQLPVLDDEGKVTGLVDEHEIGHAYHELLARLRKLSASGTPIAAPPSSGLPPLGAPPRSDDR